MPFTLHHIKSSELTPDLLLKQFNISPNETITVTIKTETKNVSPQQKPAKKRRIKFLHTAKAENITGETDIAENHDKYLYDVSPHNEV